MAAERGWPERLENDQVYIVVALYVIGAAIIALSVVQRSSRTASIGVFVLGLSYLYERLLIHNARNRENELRVVFIQDSDSPFAVDAVRRIKNWSELGAFEYKEILLASWFKQYEYLGDPSTRLDEEEEVFQIHVHARPWESIHGDADYNFDFDAVIGFDYEKMDGEESLDVEYRSWIKVFEESFLTTNCITQIPTSTCRNWGQSISSSRPW